jgi:hypothetical protein
VKDAAEESERSQTSSKQPLARREVSAARRFSLERLTLAVVGGAFMFAPIIISSGLYPRILLLLFGLACLTVAVDPFGDLFWGSSSEEGSSKD